MRRLLAVVIGILFLAAPSIWVFAAQKTTCPMKPGTAMKSTNKGMEGMSCPMMGGAAKNGGKAKMGNKLCGDKFCPAPQGSKGAVKKPYAMCPMMGGKNHKMHKSTGKLTNSKNKKK